jgi:hypothetical protein
MESITALKSENNSDIWFSIYPLVIHANLTVGIQERVSENKFGKSNLVRFGFWRIIKNIKVC